MITVWYIRTKDKTKGEALIINRDFASAREAQAWCHSNDKEFQVYRITQGNFVFQTQLVDRPGTNPSNGDEENG